MIAGVALRVDRLWDGAPARPTEAATVTVRRDGDGAVHVHVDAPDHGDPAPESPPGSTDRLWEYEVVELFLLGDDARYTEVELGPGGHYLVLRLEGRRNPVEVGLPLEASVWREGGRWGARARIPAALIPPGELRGNAYAIHGQGEQRRYLAWTPVPGDGPDFHRLERFGVLGI